MLTSNNDLEEKVKNLTATVNKTLDKLGIKVDSTVEGDPKLDFTASPKKQMVPKAKVESDNPLVIEKERVLEKLIVKAAKQAKKKNYLMQYLSTVSSEIRDPIPVRNQINKTKQECKYL